MIFGQMRRVIASMRIEEINRDREKFPLQIQHSLEAERRKISALAEAAAIDAKLEAEVWGQYEILAKKGESPERIISACGGSQEAAGPRPA